MASATHEVPREKRMSLGEHLVELRKRLLYVAIAIAAASVAGWFLSEWIWQALEGPVEQIAHTQDREAQIVFPTVTSAFDLRFKIAIYSGIVISSPVWLYQIFAYLVPGLTRRERKYAFGFVFTAIPLFGLGCAVGWFAVPNIVSILTSFVPADSASYLDATYYFQFVLRLVIALGIAFVLPVFLVILNFVGLLSAASIIRSWRMALILILVFTALVTPAADVLSMFLLAAPMVVLYLGAWGVAALHDKRAASVAAAFDASVEE